jgi:hypothetical protein
MTWIYLTIPLMLVAIGIATVPVLYCSIREHQRIHGQAVARSNTKPVRSDYWTRSVSRHDIRARQAVRAGEPDRATTTLEVRDPGTDGERDEASRERTPEPTLA